MDYQTKNDRQTFEFIFCRYNLIDYTISFFLNCCILSFETTTDPDEIRSKMTPDHRASELVTTKRRNLVSY